MAGWHSLSGYLQYKSGNNALGRLITKRRLWCVLEESQCQLLYYKCEEDVHKHRPCQGHIDINGAAISLDLENQNQFVILSDGKEHIFTAENHESMMIWLLGLQAKRDLHSRKSAANEDNSKIQDSTKQPKQCDYEVWKPSLYMPRVDAGGLSGSNRSSPGTGQKPFHWDKYELHKWGESVDSGFTVYKRTPRVRLKSDPNLITDRKKREGNLERLESTNTARSRSLPPLFEGLIASKSFPIQSPPLLRRSTETSKMSTSASMLYPDTSDSDDVFGGDVTTHVQKKPCLNRNWKKIQSAVIGHVINSNRLPSNETVGDIYSVSSRSASSDSAIDRGESTPAELSARLAELERELISTKCELAKVLNQQTCYQELLKHREDTIKSLEGNHSNGVQHNALPADGKAKRTTDKQSKAEKMFQEKIRVLQNQNRFLNEEVKKLARIRLQEHSKYQLQNQKLLSLEADIEKWKMDYVCLIQSSIRYPGEEGIEDLELCLYGGDKICMAMLQHKKRVQALLEEARKINPRLPTYDSLANNEVHVDIFGFKHVYTNTGLLLHYLCTELTYHYLVQAGVYEEHQKLWTVFMRQHGKAPMKVMSELKILCRGGIPDRFRKQIWRTMIHYKVRDIMKERGDHYYRNLCNMLPESPLAACYRKQVSLDLMRTMPNNIKFSSVGSKGIMDLQDVLLAFCIHNPTIGYCQGMNFIVGMALIFMDAEDAFWTLVAVAERYFSPHYFDHNLIGAQSDQQVLKDLVQDKLPALYHHLESIDIELSTITLNWFLAVFFDAVPFQTLLRVWDCFLLEGPKVLFRFALAILKLHEKDILQKTDTMGIMKHLKACAKLTYDIEGLVKLGFEGLKPFPLRRDIISKQTCYLNALKEKHKKKELQRLAFAEREQMYMAMEAEAGTFMGIECAVAFADDEKVWFCYGDQHIGRLCYVVCDQSIMTSVDYKLDSRLMCMCTMGTNRLVLGTISWMLVSVDIVKHEQIWQIQLHDAILSVCCYDDDDTMATRIFSGLADGTVAVTEKPYSKVEPNLDVMYIPIGQAPVTCLMLLGDQLWTASGNTVAVLHAKTLDAMDTFSVSVNPYDHILSLVPSNYGIWISLRGSSILELWDPKTLNCRMLYDTRTDRYPQLRKEDDTYFNRARITSTLANGNTVWVGTGEGNMIVYEIVESAQLKTPTENSPSIETSSGMSYIVRPDKHMDLCSADITARLNEMYSVKQDAYCSADSLDVHTDADDTKSFDSCIQRDDYIATSVMADEGFTPSSEEKLSASTKQKIFGSMRRRSSSENDIIAFQNSRYSSDGLAVVNQEKQELKPVSQKLSHKNSSENDLTRLSVGSKEDLDEEMEQKLEAQARRESLSRIMETETVDNTKWERIRHTSSGSGSGKDTKRQLNRCRDVLKLRENKSEDSGSDSRSRAVKNITSDSSSRKSSKSRSRKGSSDSLRKRNLLHKDVSSFEMEEDVFEAELEQMARRASLVNIEIDNETLELSEEELHENCIDTMKMKTIKRLCDIQQTESMQSDSTLSMPPDTGDLNVPEEPGMPMNRIKTYLPSGDDSYLSSSPSQTIIGLKYNNHRKTTPLGMSLDSVDGFDVAAHNKIASEIGDSKCKGQDEKRIKQLDGRRASVIDDISILCSDCKVLSEKCSECNKLLTGQELLKQSERRRSEVDSFDKSHLSKLNGIKGTVNEVTEIENESSSHDNTTFGVEKVMDVDNALQSHFPQTSVHKILANVSDGAAIPHRRKSREQMSDESTGVHEYKTNMYTMKKKRPSYCNIDPESDNALTTDASESKKSVHSDQEKVFPNSDTEKRDLTRQEKVGYWLSSISKTLSLSNDRDDIISEGHKLQDSLIAKEGRMGTCADDTTDSDRDVFYNPAKKLSDSSPTERPSSLNLGHHRSGIHGNGRTFNTTGVTGSQGSDGSVDMSRRSSAMSEITVSKKDAGIQYRLDFSGVHVETDIDSEDTAHRSSVGDTSIQNLAKHGNMDSRKSSLDLGTIQEHCSRLETHLKRGAGMEQATEKHGVRQTDRQRIFEFLKTPSLASRHMSLGLKIIEDDLEWTELYSAQCSTPSPGSTADQRVADFLRTPSMSSKASSLWSSYENISTPSQPEAIDSKLLHPTHHHRGRLSHSASTASVGSDNDIIYNVDLQLEAKVKISDKPVKCLLATRIGNEPIIMSFAGSYGDDEAVLKWRKHENEQLWTNEPILELCPKTRTAILPSYMRRRLSSNSSFTSHVSHGSGESQKH